MQEHQQAKMLGAIIGPNHIYLTEEGIHKGHHLNGEELEMEFIIKDQYNHHHIMFHEKNVHHQPIHMVIMVQVCN
jgi:hypothetical protein